MQRLAETFISACDLAEAEGRLLRDQVRRLFVVGLMMFIAVVAIVAGSVLAAIALYKMFILAMSPVAALILLALLLYLVAGGVLWRAARYDQQR